MYGTVARVRLKPGMEERMQELMDEFEGRQVHGFIAQYTYRMDSDPNEYITAVIFESKEAHFANANSPEQNAIYQRMMELVEGEPEWHDGEIVYAKHPA